VKVKNNCTGKAITEKLEVIRVVGKKERHMN
jgi:hypothetical protein